MHIGCADIVRRKKLCKIKIYCDILAFYWYL